MQRSEEDPDTAETLANDSYSEERQEISLTRATLQRLNLSRRTNLKFQATIPNHMPPPGSRPPPSLTQLTSWLHYGTSTYTFPEPDQEGFIFDKGFFPSKAVQREDSCLNNV